MTAHPQIPPQLAGEGDRAAQRHGGGGAAQPRATPPPNRHTIARARQLRRGFSLPERLLWRALRDHPAGCKFRRQHPCGRYVLDFYCADTRLCVEVDGQSHDMGERWVRDEARDRWLTAHGIATLRIPALHVLKDLPAALDAIVAAALARRPHHHGAARRGPPPQPAAGEAFAADPPHAPHGEGDRREAAGF